MACSRFAVAAFVAVAVAAILPLTPARATDRDLASCPTTLAPTRPGGKPLAFSYLQLMVGSPEGKFGQIGSTTSEFDPSGKRGRDIFPTDGEPNLFLRCHYEGNRVKTVPLPPGTRQCEVNYHYINDYDMLADRIFCR